MDQETSVEVYLDFRKFEEDWDFDLDRITHNLQIHPTETLKVGEWMTPNRRSTLTQWKYSTGAITTTDFESVGQLIFDVFKDKASVINEVKNELGVKTKLCAITNVHDGRSPGYSFPVNVMKFAVSIDTLIEIDEYVYGFTEDDANKSL